MERPLRVTAIPKKPIDLDRFVAALLALAIARADEERAARAEDEEEDD